MVAMTQAAAMRLATRALAGDERANLVRAARVEDMARLDPAAPRGPHAETHLSREPLGAMAIAVDRDQHAGGRRAPRDGAVHVEMARCAVDFHGSAARRRGRE